MANIYDLSDTWNDGGTTFNAIKMNVTDTASAAASLLMDLQVGGASKFSVSKGGAVTSVSGYTNGNFFVNSTGNRLSVGGSFCVSESGNQGPVIYGSGYLGWFSSTVSINAPAPDLTLYRDAANTLAQRNSTNAQTFNLYNTYTDASNYERGFMKWNSNVLEIGTEAAGTGTSRTLKISNSSTVQISPANAVIQADGNIRPTSNGSNNLGTASVYWATLYAINTVQSGYKELSEMTAPAAGSATSARIFAQDNGSGKTQLMVQFGTGAAQQIAIEP